MSNAVIADLRAVIAELSAELERIQQECDSWKAWHREIARTFGLQVVERNVTLRAAADLAAADSAAAAIREEMRAQGAREVEAAFRAGWRDGARFSLLPSNSPWQEEAWAAYQRQQQPAAGGGAKGGGPWLNTSAIAATSRSPAARSPSRWRRRRARSTPGASADHARRRSARSCRSSPCRTARSPRAEVSGEHQEQGDSHGSESDGGSRRRTHQ